MQKCFEVPTLPSRLDAFVGPKIESGTSRWGLEVTPGKPSFHENFPDFIEISLLNTENIATSTGLDQYEEWINGNTTRFQVYFYIIPGNYNHVPVYDVKLNKVTNGCDNNKSFSIEVSDVYYENDPPIYTETYKEWLKNPNDPKWQDWGWGNRPYDPTTGIKADGRVVPMLTVDPYTGLVTGDIIVLYLRPNTYHLPATLKVSNGNGTAEKNITFVLSVNNTNNRGKYINQEDLPI